MANMMDYLDWRGDLTFTASGFNEVDNLLFAELVYTSFDGIVTGQSEAEAVTLAEASAVFWEQNSREEILARVSMTKAAPFVLEKMAKTERFRDVKLWGYVNDISEEEQSQFAVMCAGLPDGSIYVSFRGTDNTITGWREDFNMGYLSGDARSAESRFVRGTDAWRWQLPRAHRGSLQGRKSCGLCCSPLQQRAAGQDSCGVQQ